MTTLLLADDTATGRRLAEWSIDGLPDEVSVRTIIAARVRDEVARHNLDPRPVFAGLVQPVEDESRLNGYAGATRRAIDAEAQIVVAERAFEQNGFFVLVGDRQLTSLDESVDLRGDPVVTFVRLVPLAGG